MPGASSSTTVGVSGSAGARRACLPCRRHDCLHLPRIRGRRPKGPACLGTTEHLQQTARAPSTRAADAVSARHTVDQNPADYPRHAGRGGGRRPSEGRRPRAGLRRRRGAVGQRAVRERRAARRHRVRPGGVGRRRRGHGGRHRPRHGRAGAAPRRTPPALRSGSHPRSRPVLIARLATTWAPGTSRPATTVWFTLVRKPGPAAEPATTPAPEHERTWSATEEARWLLHVPASLARRLDPVDLVQELAARLRDAGRCRPSSSRSTAATAPGPASSRAPVLPRPTEPTRPKRSRRAAADHDRSARHHPARPARGRRRRTRPSWPS